MKKINLQLIAILTVVFMASMSMAKDFLVISISQDFPMKNGETNLKKNFYINVGNKDGIIEGTKLNVYRNKLLHDPYQTKKNYSYKIKIGELKVIHTEPTSSIAILSQLTPMAKQVQLDVNGVMIGDNVEVSIK